MRNLKVRLKMLVGFGSIAIIIAIVGVYCVLGIQNLGNSAIAALEKAQAVSEIANIQQIETQVTTVVAVAFSLTILFGLFLAISISKSIRLPLGHMRDALAQVGHSGDFVFDNRLKTVMKDVAQNKDEIGECMVAFTSMIDRFLELDHVLTTISNGDISMKIQKISDKDTMGIAMEKMVTNLGSTFGQIGNTSDEVAVSAKEIAENSIHLAQAATEQTAAVEALVRSINNVSQKTKENSAMAINAARLGDTIKSNAEKGSQQMNQMMEAVKMITEASASIGKVIKVIDDIAFQTNILALNAAVEAARAGQHGKGFAVVAEEVRNLAAKSANAAKETGALIANSIEKAELGAKIANETSASLSEIVAGINESSRIVNVIAQSSEQQTNAINEISGGVSQVGEVVELISKGAELSSQASTVMNQESESLRDEVAHYQLGKKVRAASKPKAATGSSYNMGKY